VEPSVRVGETGGVLERSRAGEEVTGGLGGEGSGEEVTGGPGGEGSGEEVTGGPGGEGSGEEVAVSVPPVKATVAVREGVGVTAVLSGGVVGGALSSAGVGVVSAAWLASSMQRSRQTRITQTSASSEALIKAIPPAKASVQLLRLS
jgi:hypothetical protein